MFVTTNKPADRSNNETVDKVTCDDPGTTIFEILEILENDSKSWLTVA